MLSTTKITDLVWNRWITKCQSNSNINHLRNKIFLNSDRYAFFGGFIRDAILGRESKDIDIVCKMYNGISLENVLESFEGKKRTIFGGYKFVLDQISFDIWDFSQVRAFTSGQFKPTWEEMIRSVPFNIMGVIMTNTLDLYKLPEFDQGMDNEVISFVNREEVYLEAMKWMYASKAISFANKYHFRMDDEVLKYIADYLESGGEVWEPLKLKHFDLYDHLNDDHRRIIWWLEKNKTEPDDDWKNKLQKIRNKFSNKILGLCTSIEDNRNLKPIYSAGDDLPMYYERTNPKMHITLNSSDYISNSLIGKLVTLKNNQLELIELSKNNQAEMNLATRAYEILGVVSSVSKENKLVNIDCIKNKY